ncbi:MAG: polynucleotide adenylyltransferase PcnB [Treponema sp.]|jgi:poly(A) polymerase|nr:polynucleotide adenylyltransferase PcnB [Treponema sp.]
MRFRYSAEENGKLVKKAIVYTRDEHGINFEDVDIEAIGIVRRLKDAGYESYIVGGAVRDLILKKKPKDFDIASEANPSRIKKIFRNSRIIGRRFKLVHVYFGPRIFEVSTFRSLKDGLTSNTFGTIDDDVLRRDFTMNALFYDPEQQIVVDYVGGMKDIRAKLVKPIIPLATIFKDDPVRMIRAIKYSAATGFTLPLSLKWKIKTDSPLLASISPSRLTEEIFKIIHSPQAARIVEALDDMGLYAYLQHQAAQLMKDNPLFRSRYLRSMAALNQAAYKNLPGEALGALVNDYIEDIADWEQGITENYRACYTAARRFIRPMNPPRFQLDYAVRRFFAAHGITIRKSHLVDRVTRSRPAAQETENNAVDAPAGVTHGSAHSGAQRKRRRRRKKREPVTENK